MSTSKHMQNTTIHNSTISMQPNAYSNLQLTSWHPVNKLMYFTLFFLISSLSSGGATSAHYKQIQNQPPSANIRKGPRPGGTPQQTSHKTKGTPRKHTDTHTNKHTPRVVMATKHIERVSCGSSPPRHSSMASKPGNPSQRMEKEGEQKKKKKKTQNKQKGY